MSNFLITESEYVDFSRGFVSEKKRLETLLHQHQKNMNKINGRMNRGVHEITFDASALSAGVYYYKLVSGKFYGVKKMLLIK